MRYLRGIGRSVVTFLLGNPNDPTDERRRVQYTLGNWRIDQ